MSTHYERIAGQSLERLAALSDGVFAVAMTLLVLDLGVPAIEDIHNDAELWPGLVKIAPSVVAYLMSFLTLGIFWLGQQAQFAQFERSDRKLAWLTFGFLFFVSVMPFSTKLLAEFHTDDFHIPLIIYWANIFLLGMFLLFARAYVSRAGLIKDGVAPEMWRAGVRRIIQAQCMYLVCLLISFFSTSISILAFILVQTNYAIVPWVRYLYRGLYRLVGRTPSVDIE